MILLAMYGRARSGKDTAADYLAKELGLYKYAFAEPLKTMLKSVFGDHFHEGDRSGICPETGKSYREMMQTLGTEWGRELMTEDVWINLVQKKWEWVKDGCPVETNLGTMRSFGFGGRATVGMILSDLRFDSEAEWVKSQGGIVIQIERGEPGRPPGILGHQSEAGVDSKLVDLLVSNEGSLEELHELLDSLVHTAQNPGWGEACRKGP